jgi:hypothetical protein
MRCHHKVSKHDLKDKRILDSGATNDMTGNSKLLDGTTCLVASISAYLGNNEELMATQIGLFNSPRSQSQFKKFLVSALNSFLAPNCAKNAGLASMQLEVTSISKEETS